MLVLLLLLALAATAGAGEPRAAVVNQARGGGAPAAGLERGDLPLRQIRPVAGAADGLFGDAGDVAASAKRAGGGSCVTPAGSVLDCPKGGGPRCGEGKVGTCRCVELTNKTWAAVSACAEPERPDGRAETGGRSEAPRARKRTALIGGSCDGGDCYTSSGLQLNCPVSGGPECEDADICSCFCTQRSTGGWSTNNVCLPPL